MLRLFGSVRHGIRIPDCATVELPAAFAALVDHPDMQRLRRVRQLGPIHLIYPGAMHTRFEHSLGVFWAVLAYVESLLLRAEFQERVEEEDLLCILAAALLHDVGHYPFAHSLEALHSRAFEAPRHEDLAGRIIRGELTVAPGQPTVGDLLEGELGVDRHRVAALVQFGSSHNLPARERLLASLINSAIDADKLDYLRRDSIHLGIPYGRMPDLDHLTANLGVNPAGDRIALTSKGRVSGEIFLFCRHLMFSEAYWHHTARAASVMIEEALADYVQRKQLGLEDLTQMFLNGSDDELLALIVRDRDVGGSHSQELLAGLTSNTRGLYKRVLSLNRSPFSKSRSLAYEQIYRMERAEVQGLATRMRQRLEKLLGEPTREDGLFIDTPPRDKDRVEMVEVVFEGETNQRALRLDEVSEVARGIATDFLKIVKKIRVFVSPRVREGLRGKEEAALELLLEEVLG